MNDCVRLIIGGDRGREREGGKRSVDQFDPEQPGRPRRERDAGDKEGAQS